MSVHRIRCKRTGEAIADKLDGGWCACPSVDECRLREERSRPEEITLVGVDGKVIRVFK